MTKETGGPAFPCTAEQWQQGFCGMELRDYFAAKAMHALITELPWGPGATSLLVSESPDGFEGEAPARFAHVAYKLADAMLAQRSKP